MLLNIIASISNNLCSKNKQIIKLCNDYIPLEKYIDFNQNHTFSQDSTITGNVSDAFLSNLATIEFGYNGWLFAGGSSKIVDQQTIVEITEFGKIYGEQFGHSIPLATGATAAFMEIINACYAASGNYAITATTNFPSINNMVNQSIKYCFTARSFVNMESFLVKNAIAGIFFNGGSGTAYEFFLMIITRYIKNTQLNIPLIFISSNSKCNVLYNTIKEMQGDGFISNEDGKNIFLTHSANEAIDILKSVAAFKKPPIKSCSNDLIRQIFTVSPNRYFK
jgi:predicted Rossmann-fold nucleotide-binding protein